MEGYRLFFFERGHIAGARVIKAEDRAAAIEEARTLAGDTTVELWFGTEKIKTFNPVL